MRKFFKFNYTDYFFFKKNKLYYDHIKQFEEDIIKSNIFNLLFIAIFLFSTIQMFILKITVLSVIVSALALFLIIRNSIFTINLYKELDIEINDRLTDDIKKQYYRGKKLKRVIDIKDKN